MIDTIEKTPLISTHETDNLGKVAESVRLWASSAFSSKHVISHLHEEVLEDISVYERKGMTGLSPGEFRKEDLILRDSPPNFYVHGTDVGPVMEKYCDDLDLILRNKIPNMNPVGDLEEILEKTSWAYYVFIRIHPFLDGNGRVGRAIINRCLLGAGLGEIEFLGPWYQKYRNARLDAMNLVDKIKSLSPLQLYLLRSLPIHEKNPALIIKIEELIAKKETEVRKVQPQNSHLGQLWDGFVGLDLYGNLEETPLSSSIAS